MPPIVIFALVILAFCSSKAACIISHTHCVHVSLFVFCYPNFLCVLCFDASLFVLFLFSAAVALYVYSILPLAYVRIPTVLRQSVL